MGDNAANIVPPHELGSKEQAAAMKTEQPPLTDWEFKQYNRLAETMDYFHNHFRQEWNDMWNTCINGPAPQGRALADFLQKGIGFCFMLNVHHSIEEARVFPQLRRMPEFEKNELMESHHVQIHAGLESLHEYLERCQAGEAEFDLGAMRAKMETWREVLWTHLDAEVEALGAENMRKYFTIEEVRRLGM